MAQELLFTSAPRGLRPGASGYCTVGCTQGLSSLLTERLESLSGYRHLFLPGDPQSASNPVNYSHVQFSVANKSYSLLSRIASFGSDYTHRSNKLAHHILLERAELPKAGPAWALSQPGVMRDGWNGEVSAWTKPPVLPSGTDIPGVCKEWGRLTGDGGWGGVLAEAASDPSRPCYLIFSPGMELLPLLRESLALLPPNRRWDVTFSTFYTGLPQDVRCSWRCVVAGSDNAQAAERNPQALVIDLTQKLPPANGGDLVVCARTGRAPRMSAAPARVSTPPVMQQSTPPVVAASSPPMQREPRVEMIPEADESSGTYRLAGAAAPAPAGGPRLVATPVAPPPFQAVPMAPPEPPPPAPPPVTQPLPAGSSVPWKPIGAILTAILLLGIGVLLGKSGTGREPPPQNSTKHEETTKNDNSKSPIASKEATSSTSLDRQLEEERKRKEEDDRKRLAKAEKAQQERKDEQEKQARLEEETRLAKLKANRDEEDRKAKGAEAMAKKARPNVHPLGTIANSPSGAVLTLKGTNAETYLWYLAAEKSIFKSLPDSTDIRDPSNQSQVDLKIGEDTIGTVKTEIQDQTRVVKLDWSEFDSSRLNQLARGVLIVQNQEPEKTPQRYPVALCPPVRVEGAEGAFSKDGKGEFQFRSSVALKSVDNFPSPWQVMAAAQKLSTSDDAAILIQDQRFPLKRANAESGENSHSLKFSSTALDGFVARMFALSMSAPAAIPSAPPPPIPQPTPMVQPTTEVSVLLPKAEDNPPRIQIQFQIAFSPPRETKTLAQNAEAFLEQLRKNKQQIKTPVEAPDFDVQEKRREKEVQDLDVILTLLEARREGKEIKGVRISLKATEKVGDFDVPRLEINPPSPLSEATSTGNRPQQTEIKQQPLKTGELPKRPG